MQIDVLGLESVAEPGDLGEQASITDGDGGLGREQLQHLESVRRERSARQVVLEVHHPDEAALVQHRRAKDRRRLVARDVRVAPVGGVARRVREHDALRCAPHVIDNRGRQISARGHGRALQHMHLGHVHGAASLNERLALVLQDEKALASAGILDQDAHQFREQPFQIDLTTDGLRRLHDGDEVDARDLGSGGGLRQCLGLEAGDLGREAGGQGTIATVQVRDLRAGAPLGVGVPRFGQEPGGNAWMSSLQPEPGVQFVRQRLVLERARLRGVPDGALVQVERRELLPGETGVLRREEQRLAEKVLRAVLREDRKRLPHPFQFREIDPSLILGGVGVVRRQGEAIPEIEHDGPDRSGQMIHHFACGAGGFQRRSIFSKRIAELQLRHGVKCREEWVAAVRLYVCVLVDCVVGKREGGSGPPL